jgi:N-acyl-D-amino-acid deacylase
MTHELLIRNARVVDGTGAPARPADVAVTGGRIAAVGHGLGDAARIYDAAGLTLTPGFIDPHTHYDAQVCWDPLLTSSSWHGVTSVVMGNCGVGLAPVRADGRELAMMDLVNVEGMSPEVLHKGIRWEWERFADFIQAATRGVALNCGFFVPLAPLRQFVMGEAASDRAATPEETARIAAELEHAMAHGALGFSTTVLPQHVGHAGRPLAARLASREELRAYCHVLRGAGRGVIQIALGGISGLGAEDQALLDFLLTESGRPVTWAFLLALVEAPQRALEVLDQTEHLIARGAIPQVSCRPFMSQVELRKPFLFGSRKTFQPIINADAATQLAAYRDPAFRAALKEELRTPSVFNADWDRIEVQSVEHPALQPYVGRTVAEIGLEEGRDGLDVFFDIAVRDELAARFLFVIANTDPEVVSKLVSDPRTLIGASDGGAHVDQICDVGYATWLLRTWVRERGALTLERAVQRLTEEPARLLGLADRGRIAPGLRADLTLLDPATVGSDRLPEARFDLPGGERRLVSVPRGIRATWVAGTQLYEDGQDSGARVGEVLRPH